MFSLGVWPPPDGAHHGGGEDRGGAAQVRSHHLTGKHPNISILRPIIVFFGAVAVGLHLALFLIPTDYTNIFLYVRNQFLAWSFLFSMVQILDFLKFHHMFGPWAIIISSLLVDLGKFMTVLFLFLIGFSMLVTAMNTPFYQLTEVEIL